MKNKFVENKFIENSGEILEEILMNDENTISLISIPGKFTKMTSHPNSFFPIPGRILVNGKDEIKYIETHGQGMTLGAKVSDIKDDVEIEFEDRNGKIYKRNGANND